MTKDISLRPFAAEDSQVIVSWNLSEKDIYFWAGEYFRHPLDSSQLEKHVADRASNPHWRIYSAVDTISGEVVGHIDLRYIEVERRFARVGHVLLKPSLRGQGIGTKMVKEVLKIGFEEIGLHRIDLGVIEVNPRAIRCYEKAGFVKEGVTREVVRFEDEYWNLIQMSILEQDWINSKRKVSLRPFSREDFQTIIDWNLSERDLSFWSPGGIKYPLDNSQLEKSLNYFEGNPRAKGFSAIDSESGELLGRISLVNIDPNGRYAWIIQALVKPSLQRKGVGTRMVNEVLKIVFDEIGLHRVDLLVWSSNKSAIRCFEKAGFVRECILRDAVKIGDEYQDTYQMSMLKQEWKGTQR